MAFELIITRPLSQARAWQTRCAERGIATRLLPLIEIAAVDDPLPLRSAWSRLSSYALVVFVSPNAVTCFFAAASPACAWPEGVLAGSTGPGTTAALAAARVAPPQIVEPAADAASFDSEALWAQLRGRDWQGARVLIVRGDGGRDWLANTLRERGAAVDFVQAYARRPPHWNEPEREILRHCLMHPERCIWWLSSSEAVANLRLLAPEADWRASQALASHPRIARSAIEAGFGEVKIALPTLDAVAGALADWGRDSKSRSIQSIEP